MKFLSKLETLDNIILQDIDQKRKNMKFTSLKYEAKDWDAKLHSITQKKQILSFTQYLALVKISMQISYKTLNRNLKDNTIISILAIAII